MSVMKQVIESFTPLSKWRINHKRLWLEYLKTGKLQFSPTELHNAIQEIANKPENRPRGEKLLLFRKRYNFTLKEDKFPYRPEEALERFVTVSNEDNFFNQVPVGGGKESIDIVVRHSGNSVEFVELKPWNSGDSPLYALIEGLKNLIEYRIIVEHQIQAMNHPSEVNISMLAPREYYRNFFLLDDSNTALQDNIQRTINLLNELANEFDTKISIISLGFSAKSFKQACSQLYDEQGLEGQQVASITKQHGITSLKYSNWVELASTD